MRSLFADMIMNSESGTERIRAYLGKMLKREAKQNTTDWSRLGVQIWN